MAIMIMKTEQGVLEVSLMIKERVMLEGNQRSHLYPKTKEVIYIQKHQMFSIILER